MADHQSGVLESAGAVIPRTVNTLAELAALDDEAVIRDDVDYVFEKQNSKWYECGDPVGHTSHYIDLPATVLHEGTPS
jgi:hypothetical protein